MKLLGFEFRRSSAPAAQPSTQLALPTWEMHRELMSRLDEKKQAQTEEVLHRLLLAQQNALGSVTPETCMRSPTVQAIVTACTRRFAVTPVAIYQKGVKDGRETREKLPNHTVAKLLQYPNNFQTRVNYWQDAVSWILRYGRYYAYKSRGSTGPIRALIPMNPRGVTPKLDPTLWTMSYRWTPDAGGQQEYPASKVHHVRGPARDGYTGDSPINDCRTSIALEIAAEDFGASFFANGALPLMIFQYLSGNKGMKSAEDEKQFIDDIQNSLSGDKRHRGLLLPAGMGVAPTVSVENDKAQMIESRRYQRTVIAGAFGVPPHLVGDLERATFNNVEQQDGDFTLNVIMPIAQAFEAAMELDLLTNEDTSSGVCIRFNLDSILRADFKSRQEGSQIQRQNGVISPNEWREREGLNPIATDDGGDEYIRPANMVPAMTPAATATPAAQASSADSGYGKAGDTNVDVTPIFHIKTEITIPPGEPPVVNVKTAPVTVELHAADVNVGGSTVNMRGGNTTVETSSPQQQPGGDITVNLPVINVDSKTYVAAADAPVVNNTVNVQPPEVHLEATIEPPVVHVAAPVVNVDSPTVNVVNDVEAPVVHVEPAQVKVEAPVVNVAAPIVNIEPPPPAEVKVEAPIVNIDSPVIHVAAPTVNVEAARAPNVVVEAPPPTVVNVEAPNVKVENVVRPPEYEQTEVEAVRDESGRLVKTITRRQLDTLTSDAVYNREGRLVSVITKRKPNP